MVPLVSSATSQNDTPLAPWWTFALPLHFALEFDALYRREGYTLQNFDANFFHSYGGRARSNSWEFPIIAKYRLPAAARGAPYVGIGYAPRIVYGSQVDTYIQNDLSGNAVSVSSTKRDSNYDATHGLVIEGGFNLAVPHFHVSPEIRYTRWHTPFLPSWARMATFTSPSEIKLRCYSA